MKFGCLITLLLLPITLLIWVKRERHRRASLPLEELKKLEDEESFGSIDETIECIYCHQKSCVRTQIEVLYEDGTDANSPEGIALLITNTRWGGMPPKNEHIAAHCMNCGSHWNKFLEKQS